MPTTRAEAIARAGATRSQAFVMFQRLCEVLETLTRPAGRPAATRADDDVLLRLSQAVTRFLSEHPGCWNRGNTRATYSDDFRRFIVSQFGPGGLAENTAIEHAASAMTLPLGTLKDWLYAEMPSKQSELSELRATENNEPSAQPVCEFSQPQLATLLAEYPQWKGCLSSFCTYARTQLGLPFGRSFITTVLTSCGLYTPKTRRPTQAPWSRGSMRFDFPGMQWFGDGKKISVELRGQCYDFNLEAYVDGASHATVGVKVTDTEDSYAVVDTFYDALHTVQGQNPLAVTLDNRPSNDAPIVEQALRCCYKLHATPYRGQAKAPVEGAFGLFAQSLPCPLVIEGYNDRDIARSIGNIVGTAFFLGRNGRPSRKLGWKTPVETYLTSNPTDEQNRKAQAWLLQLRRRQQLAHETRKRRSDPVRRSLVARELKQLEIDDPKGKIALSICGFSKDAILTGISIFKAKKQRGTLPDGCLPERYLQGIIRNVQDSWQLDDTMHYLLELRLQMHEEQLNPLQAQASEMSASARSAFDRVCAFVDQCLQADSVLAFHFWTSRAIEAMGEVPRCEVVGICKHISRLIASSFRVKLSQRQKLLSYLLAAAVPVAD